MPPILITWPAHELAVLPLDPFSLVGPVSAVVAFLGTTDRSNADVVHRTPAGLTAIPGLGE